MKLVALVLLFSAFSSLTLMEVVKDFKSKCSDFFIPNPENQNDVIIPTVIMNNTYQMICQRWKNKYRFATLYDTVRRIPVYSAYTFFHKVNTTRSKVWRTEPQLERVEKYKEQTEMRVSPKTAGNITHQAVYSDYTRSNYTRGHVFPRSHAADQDHADSTFTLTNVAPQKEHSNVKWAEKVEKPMLEEIKHNCRLDQNHLAYIVTGVVPGDRWIPITRSTKSEEGINIPSHFWSAFCCRDNHEKLNSKAYIAEQENFTREQMTVKELNEKLTALYKNVYKQDVDFSVFPGLNL